VVALHLKKLDKLFQQTCDQCYSFVNIDDNFISTFFQEKCLYECEI
jgi:hypothetical protein